MKKPKKTNIVTSLLKKEGILKKMLNVYKHYIKVLPLFEGKPGNYLPDRPLTLVSGENSLVDKRNPVVGITVNRRSGRECNKITPCSPEMEIRRADN